ncbi:hypothetical protein M8494_01270 [Serratia ureilytica]
MRTTGIWALALTTLIGSQSVSAADLPGKGIAVQPVQAPFPKRPSRRCWSARRWKNWVTT